MPIQPIQGAVPFQPLEGSSGVRSTEETSGADLFAKMLADSVKTTNDGVLNAQAAAESFAAGKSDDIHGTMIATTSADIQLRTLGTVRNKVMDAFYEIWRMSV